MARGVARGRAEWRPLDAADAVGLPQYVFAIDRRVIMAAPDRPQAVRQLWRTDFVGLPFSGSAYRALADHPNAQAARVGWGCARASCCTDWAMLAVGPGKAVGVVAERAVHIVVIPLTEPWTVRHLSLCWRDGAALTPLARGCRIVRGLLARGRPRL
ncbi:MAG: hypothetical protein Q4G22_01665 [Paracoccus sp. (in: a-proteobacteria)]|uniref:hypothetical protein n=1 Tax=Paracoccus sp. TaxID=267 RepID=UPI0026DF9E40|nr:hypothetical protein [Paracoccus sp. (in: a-proteobacteria)]MDO5630524.1 hypothetical protein [Paracoccus sp. (in: a-proteobacteria)]